MSSLSITNEKIVADGRTGLPSFMHYDPYYPRLFEHLKSLLAQGIPVLLRLYPGSYYPAPEEELHSRIDREGHVVVLIGYDDQTEEIIVTDPWNKELNGGVRGGLTRIPYNTIKTQWVNCTLGMWATIVPWEIEVTWPKEVPLGEVFNIEAKIHYTCPAPLSTANYHLHACHTRLELPGNLKLVADSDTKRLGDGFLQPSETKNVSWQLVRTGPVEGRFAVRVRGMVSSTDPYLYSDIIGMKKEMEIKILSTVPTVIEK